MSDQEVAVAEATAEEVKTETEEAAEDQPSPTEMSSNPMEAEATSDESSADSEAPSTGQSEEVAETDSSAGSEPSTESTGEEEDEPLSILSLQRGQRLTGTVKNITNFGAFVDLGIAQDGLVHISELARRKVDNVTDVVSQGEEVEVWVKKVDKKRGRISLTMIKPVNLKLRDIEEEAELEGTVTRLEPYGAFVDIGSERDGLVHISQITHEYIKHPEDALAVGDPVNVKVLKVNRKKRQIDLSVKALLPPPQVESQVVEQAAPQGSEMEDFTTEEEPMPTAMAIAYAALQNETQNSDSSSKSAEKDKKKKQGEIDDIVARTLANREN